MSTQWPDGSEMRQKVAEFRSLTNLGTLSELEKQIAYLIQVAAANAAMQEWVESELPTSLTPSEVALLEQGFAAGYNRLAKGVLATILKMKAGAR